MFFFRQGLKLRHGIIFVVSFRRLPRDASGSRQPGYLGNHLRTLGSLSTACRPAAEICLPRFPCRGGAFAQRVWPNRKDELVCGVSQTPAQGLKCRSRRADGPSREAPHQSLHLKLFNCGYTLVKGGRGRSVRFVHAIKKLSVSNLGL